MDNIGEVGKLEKKIENYELRILSSVVLFSLVQIFICATAVVLPFRQ
jgi:hypothetical protein